MGNLRKPNPAVNDIEIDPSEEIIRCKLEKMGIYAPLRSAFKDEEDYQEALHEYNLKREPFYYEIVTAADE
ncbi:MAG: hypothetical protein DRQ48_00925 [Gammaproteobacteria bacterium]|nr:MAG: hypothetical protein DRQ44_00445 [Gammaproteobacteria bacterium]RKZ72242.1 MAG: hypothetical protein DRQ48_00925 [Gammaproteobacteria bacterium]